MKKTKIILWLTAMLLSTGSYAAMTQHIVLCLDVKDNTSPYAFNAAFYSSDVFDHKRTAAVAAGQKCVDHTYNHGPKNIALDVAVSDWMAINDIKFIPDESCPFLYSKASGWYVSDYQATSKPTEGWYINLTQAEPENGYKYVYKMTCARSSVN